MKSGPWPGSALRIIDLSLCTLPDLVEHLASDPTDLLNSVRTGGCRLAKGDEHPGQIIPHGKGRAGDIARGAEQPLPGAFSRLVVRVDPAVPQTAGCRRNLGTAGAGAVVEADAKGAVGRGGCHALDMPDRNPERNRPDISGHSGVEVPSGAENESPTQGITPQRLRVS